MYEACSAAREVRERLLADPYRPTYHFAIPEGDGRPGDPNGAFYAEGRYHLMYLYARQKGVFHWGHISSADLVHWRHHPDALVKGALDEGCFSGGAFVDEDGTAYLSFWVFNDGARTENRNAGIGIARSLPPYDRWERLPDIAIASTEWGIREVARPDGSIDPLGCADPSNIWKNNGIYYMQTGNLCVLNKYGRAPDSPPRLRGDWTELFSSADLVHWTHEGRFYDRRADNAWTDESEDDMCPSFLPLPRAREGGVPSDQYLQLFIAHNKGCQYYIGSCEGNRFLPAKHGRMSWMDNAFFAPEALIDEKGRQIMWAWLLDNCENDFDRFGWSGVFSLPRVLWLNAQGGLGIAPAPELRALRAAKTEYPSERLCDGQREIPVEDGSSCELRLILRPGQRGGVVVHGGVTIYYDAGEQSLVMDTSRCGREGMPLVERAPLALAKDEKLDLTVYVDHSVVEVFANERQAICRRVYTRDYGVFLYSQGETTFEEISVWTLSPANPH